MVINVCRELHSDKVAGMATLSTTKVSALAPDLPTGGVHYGRMSEREKKHYLKEWRLHRGLTQQALGDLVGRTKSALSKVEKFERDLGSEWANLLSGALKIAPADLFSPPSGPSVAQRPSIINQGVTDVDEMQWVHGETKKLLADVDATDEDVWLVARHIISVRKKYR